MIKLIQQTFNIYNEKDIDLDDAYEDDMEIPFITISFYVRSPYYTENISGELQLSRKYRKQFDKLIQSALAPYKEHFDYHEGDGEGMTPMDKIHTVIQDLATQIKLKFEIKDQIELYDIQLKGTWQAFHGKRDTAMMKEVQDEMSDQLAQALKDYQQEHPDE